MATYSCDECGVLSIGVMVFRIEQSVSSSYAKTVMDSREADLLWLPEKAIGKDYPDVPTPIAAAASEANSCQSIGAYRAAALMARSVIEATAKERKITTGQLKSKIDELHNRSLIRQLVRDQAHEVRLFGNDMAHGDFVDSVGQEESAEVLELMSAVLHEVYQEPAALEARKKARMAKEQKK